MDPTWLHIRIIRYLSLKNYWFPQPTPDLRVVNILKVLEKEGWIRSYGYSNKTNIITCAFF